jgi:hypothetical protein
MQVWINMSDVVQNDGLVKQHLVEWEGEATVEMVTVEDGQTHYPSDKVEVGQVLLYDIEFEPKQTNKHKQT